MMQKVVKGNQWETGEQLYIDTVLLQKVKWRKKNLAMITYDMVRHSWVIEALNMIDIAKNVVNFFGKKDEVLVSEANLWYWDTRESTYKEKDFSRGCTINIFIGNCPHTENS